MRRTKGIGRLGRGAAARSLAEACLRRHLAPANGPSGHLSHGTPVVAEGEMGPAPPRRRITGSAGGGVPGMFGASRAVRIHVAPSARGSRGAASAPRGVPRGIGIEAGPGRSRQDRLRRMLSGLAKRVVKLPSLNPAIATAPWSGFQRLQRPRSRLCEAQVVGRPYSRVTKRAKPLKRLAHPARFERATSAFGGQRSIQLSYGCLRRTVRRDASS